MEDHRQEVQAGEDTDLRQEEQGEVTDHLLHHRHMADFPVADSHRLRHHRPNPIDTAARLMELGAEQCFLLLGH